MAAYAPLIQIRSVYSAEWENLAFSVESGPSQWTLRVEERATRRLLYTALRGGVAAAQVAAAEYGIFSLPGASSRLNPERLASALPWRRHL
jgi:hypothetical protein